VIGVASLLTYAAFQWHEPHGAREFAYAPFTVEPLPYSAMRGFTYEQLWGHVRRIALAGPGLVLLVFALAGRLRLSAPRDLGRVCLRLCVLGSVLTAVLMLVVLRGRAISDDELAYAMQAGFFADGRLTGPELGVTLGDVFNVSTPAGYTVKYLPGEPLVQMLGQALGVPALLHLPLVALTSWAWFRSLRSSAGERVAWLATAALACSPMLIFTSATGLSHATCLACVALMGLGAELVRQGRAVTGALLVGASFGAGMLTRPQGIAPVALVLGVVTLWRLGQSRSLLGFAALVASSGGALSCLLFYNAKLTGSPFKLPWSEQCDAEHFGFGRVWLTSTYEHTALGALENLGVVLLRLNAWWLGLPLSLGVALAFFLLFKGRVRSLPGVSTWLTAGLAVVLFEACYYSPGASDTGAIYHYELLLPGSLLAGYVADALLTRVSWGPLALLGGLVLGTGSWLLEQGLRIERLVSTIHRDADRALSRIAPPALLIHEELADEVVRRGWVFSSFPRRFRDVDAPVVTLPRVSEDLPARAAAVYPGRSCWYFRRRPGGAEAELWPCARAEALLARPVTSSPEATRRVFWERPTAYFEADYQPFRAIFERRARDAAGREIVPCCALRERVQTQHERPAASSAPDACVETGE
jgi:hypothetical protein